MADAYIYENGVIHFGPTTPYGALKVATGEYEHLIELLSSEVHLGKRGEFVVPGVTGAVCQQEAVEALLSFQNKLLEKEGGL